MTSKLLKSNLMKNNLLIILSIITLSSCNKLSDPINGLILGSDTLYTSRISELERNGLLRDKEYGSYEYYLQLEKDSIKTVISFNIDGYDDSKLRNIKINLLGDTSYEKKSDTTFTAWKIRGYGARRCSEVEKVYNYFCKYYGEPNYVNNSLKKSTKQNNSKTKKS